MRIFTAKETAKAVNGIIAAGNEDGKAEGFSIDSREIQSGQGFFAIVGANNDGHDYLNQVIEKGCAFIVISDSQKLRDIPEGVSVILVENTTKALQSLAKWYLQTLPLKKKIGVTGSVGKTSTRDFMYYVAASKYKTGRNKKNYNNAHGLPLSILEFDEDTQIAVLEMGMDAPGEIKLLADIVRPDIAIITKIAEVNIELMKNLENIFKAKMEITEYFNEKSALIVNASCPCLEPERTRGNYKLLPVWEEPEGKYPKEESTDNRNRDDYIVKNVLDMGDEGIKYTLSRNDNEYEIQLPTAGAHNAVNSALAVCAGELIGISPAEAAEALKHAELTGRRLNITQRHGIKVIDDTYNACEASVKSAIDTLAAMKAKRRVAVIGDILGLADRAEPCHLAVGRHAAQKGIDMVIAIGDDARYYAQGAAETMDWEKVKFFSTKEEFIDMIHEIIKEGDAVLVKASRGMKLETVVTAILEG